MKHSVLSFIWLIFIIPFVNGKDMPTVKFYLDLDRTGARSSGVSIEQGIRLALSEIDYTLEGHRVELVIKDHHGSTRRSRLHMEEFIDDPSALLVYAGLHSPPVLGNLDYINDHEILLLVPWAAAGPITRTPDEEGKNWVFRVSVDDTKAGEMITSFACDREGYRRPALLLEDTGWGRSNYKTMSEALVRRGLMPAKVIWFNWNIGDLGAREMLEDIYSSGADVIFLVANATEGITFFKAMTARKERERLPIRSHWGITGGNIVEVLGTDTLVNKLNLKFIQTTFSFLNTPLSPFSRDVFSRLTDLYPDIRSGEDVKAPCGFIHAYDLTRILIRAVQQSGLVEDMQENRRRLRDALENLQSPVTGLVKDYIRPFAPFSMEQDCAHEALGGEDLRMAYFTESGGIRLVEE
jgi:branched-chain amino acid transport system substrate-binding protein